ncbi:Hypothetical protein R9X50_00602600 [Acrodontium crateriforme]|uniref:BTB domain-containing protein n=1 Tax=Acrodontium crateriforme TaxID=150365 RepID=A0AAQ3RBY0_9PEZI|nr:Hypothetical protein R9X50_00602600 [Acrodontium crateriforme]
MASRINVPLDKFAFIGIANSPTFKFWIGPQATEFVLHSAVISHFSKPLRALINAPMIEGSTGGVSWDDVEVNTFGCITEFLYTGNYVVEDVSLTQSTDGSTKPKLTLEEKTTRTIRVEGSLFGGESYVEEPPVQDPYVEEPPVRDSYEVEHIDDGRMWGYGASRKKKNFKVESNKKAKLWSDFCQITFGSNVSRETTMSDDSSLQPAKTLLAHAKIYAFAEKYDIKQLRDVCLNKLQSTLQRNSLSKGQVTTIVELLEYAHQTTPHRDSPHYDLRSLLAHYAACEMEALMQNEQFQELIGNQCGLALDITKFLMRRLSS